MNGLRKYHTYGLWRAMRDRCALHSHKSYPDYGGRGIRVCKRWMIFKDFLEDMGDPPPNHTIERMDNDGNYEPSNCRWATRTHQANNRRSSRRVTAFGKTQTLAEWEKELGFRRGFLHLRLKRWGNVEKALTAPIRRWA